MIPTTFQDVLDRLDELENRPLTVADLPMKALQNKLELGWLPDANRVDANTMSTSERLHTLRGAADALGVVTTGAGFTIVHTGGGAYTVTFATVFNAAPTVVVVPALTPTVTAGGFTLAYGGAVDTAFTFIAIGPR